MPLLTKRLAEAPREVNLQGYACKQFFGTLRITKDRPLGARAVTFFTFQAPRGQQKPLGSEALRIRRTSAPCSSGVAKRRTSSSATAAPADFQSWLDS